MGAENGADSCELWSGFDISGVASNYQSIAGILAGFTFAAFTVILDRWHRNSVGGESVDRRGLEYEKLTGIALIAAFLGLLFASFQYGTLAGERGCALIGGRAASEGLLGDVMFAAAIGILVYGLVQFAASSSASLAKHIRFIVVVLVPPIVFSFAEIRLMDLAISLGSPEEHLPLQPMWNDANRLGAPIGYTILGGCALLWCIGARRRRSAKPPGRLARATQTMLPYLTITFVVVARIRSVEVLQTIDPSAHIAPAEAWIWVALLTGLVLVQSVALSFQRSVDTFEPDGRARST